MIHIVAAIAQNGVIGKDGKIPWHISEDLKRFKTLTMGGVLIMGRKTYESIGRPLPGRKTIVLSREKFNCAPGTFEGFGQDVDIAGELLSAIGIGGGLYAGREIFVVGGAEVYREAMACADRLHLTRVHADFDGDVSFPEWDASLWKRTDDIATYCRDLSFTFETWERKVSAA